MAINIRFSYLGCFERSRSWNVTISGCFNVELIHLEFYRFQNSKVRNFNDDVCNKNIDLISLDFRFNLGILLA